MKNDININITIPGHTRYLRMIGNLGENLAKEIDCPDAIRETLSSQLAVVLTEGLVNAIKHANCREPDKTVQIKITASNKKLVIRIYDNGVGFDLDSIPPPCFSPREIDEKGRGIFILRSLMDSVRYRRSEGKNILEMIKKLG